MCGSDHFSRAANNTRAADERMTKQVVILFVYFSFSSKSSAAMLAALYSRFPKLSYSRESIITRHDSKACVLCNREVRCPNS